MGFSIWTAIIGLCFIAALGVERPPVLSMASVPLGIVYAVLAALVVNKLEADARTPHLTTL